MGDDKVFEVMSSEYFIKQIKKRYLIETKDIILHVEWSFVSANQWKKKNKHFIHLYTDDKNLKYRFSIIPLQAENMSIHIESNLARSDECLLFV